MFEFGVPTFDDRKEAPVGIDLLKYKLPTGAMLIDCFSESSILVFPPLRKVVHYSINWLL